MKTVTIQLADDEVLIAVKRAEDYDDVAPELVAEDFTHTPHGFEWRVVEIDDARGGG
jgi:hypothetical protein